jgi:hypothetical protein
MEALFAMGIIILLLILGALLTVAILFILNLQKTLAACSQENRAMEPGLVWLALIPLFNLFWIIWTVIKIRDSLQKEYEARSLDTTEVTNTYNIGLTYGVLAASGIITQFIPFIGILASIATLVFFIMYWVKTSGCRKTLSA